MKFPKQLFVSIEEEGAETQFFIADESLAGLVNDEARDVATYKLVSTKRLKRSFHYEEVPE